MAEISADEPADVAVLSDQPQSRSALTFMVGLAASGLLTAIATITLLMGDGLTGENNGLIRALLIASLVISAGLGGILVHRILRVARAWRAAATGARLHLRFVTLFSLAALAPAIIVAVFLGVTFTQGMERWFSQRVVNTIENAADVGRAYVNLASGGLGGDVEAMAEDLNVARPFIATDPSRYAAFLQLQGERRDLSSVYVIDRNGGVIAGGSLVDDAVPYHAPSPEAFAAADQSQVSVRFDQDNDRLLALYRLSAYNNAYVFVSKRIEAGLVAQLRQFETSVTEYREARSQQNSLRGLLGMAYLATALLLLLGAGWVGLTSATRVAEPIGRLVGAARRVASGDLKARVSVGEERDEVDALASAFNRMTAQLETQRRDLVTAQEDADNRRSFIEAVLGGVSAGVVGLDANGRISALNRSAVHLLGLDSGDLIGRRLIDLAPEFAELLNQPRTSQAPPQRVDLMREGGSVNLSVRMSPEADGGLVLTFDDMTTLISAQRQEAWKDVARRIAHEIKNPLTPIQLSAERLRKKYSTEITSDPDTFAKCTDTILRQVADIGRMVDEFSSFARMPAPRMAYADISEVARSTVFAQRLVFPDVRIEVEGADQPIALISDERLIGQSLLNLIKNASESVQARRERDGEPKDGFVTLRLRDLDFGVQFEVIDNGLGFPEKDRHRLIEPYVTTRTKGAGLGLAIVARVIEDHGGLFELDDAPGSACGAVVRFVLPKRGEDAIDPAAEHGAGAI
ncbi:MAG: PAS domain-containing sensor histidine kinase [Hyphomonadaceae bacterium]|nr:PAS domain-containing sensor histidine kinase [Hyphomonadaceae bacterium]